MSAFNLHTCSSSRGFEQPALTRFAGFGFNDKHLLSTLHSMIGFFLTVVISSLSVTVL
ncbi:MAG: hypothetical protein WCI90_11450 [Chlorobium sp.]|jgi:hypothetical protein